MRKKKNVIIVISLLVCGLFIMSDFFGLWSICQTPKYQNDYYQRLYMNAYNDYINDSISTINEKLDLWNYTQQDVYVRSSFENMSKYSDALTQLILYINIEENYRYHVKSHIEIGRMEISSKGQTIFKKYAESNGTHVVYPTLEKLNRIVEKFGATSKEFKEQITFLTLNAWLYKMKQSARNKYQAYKDLIGSSVSTQVKDFEKSLEEGKFTRAEFIFNQFTKKRFTLNKDNTLKYVPTARRTNGLFEIGYYKSIQTNTGLNKKWISLIKQNPTDKSFIYSSGKKTGKTLNWASYFRDLDTQSRSFKKTLSSWASVQNQKGIPDDDPIYYDGLGVAVLTEPIPSDNSIFTIVNNMRQNNRWFGFIERFDETLVNYDTQEDLLDSLEFYDVIFQDPTTVNWYFSSLPREKQNQIIEWLYMLGGQFITHPSYGTDDLTLDNGLYQALTPAMKSFAFNVFNNPYLMDANEDGVFTNDDGWNIEYEYAIPSGTNVFSVDTFTGDGVLAPATSIKYISGYTSEYYNDPNYDWLHSAVYLNQTIAVPDRIDEAIFEGMFSIYDKAEYPTGTDNTNIQLIFANATSNEILPNGIFNIYNPAWSTGWNRKTIDVTNFLRTYSGQSVNVKISFQGIEPNPGEIAIGTWEYLVDSLQLSIYSIDRKIGIYKDDFFNKNPMESFTQENLGEFTIALNEILGEVYNVDILRNTNDFENWCKLNENGVLILTHPLRTDQIDMVKSWNLQETVNDPILGTYTKGGCVISAIGDVPFSMNYNPTIENKFTIDNSFSIPNDIIFEAEDWWNADWSFRKEINIVNNEGLVVDYPAYLEIEIESTMNYDLSDIRFVNSQGVELPYEIESNDGTTFYVWVKIDSLDLGDNAIYCYYGNSNALSNENPDSVWSSYEFVSHMNSLDYYDSSPNHYDCYNNGGSTIFDGIVGQSAKFDSANEWLAFSLNYEASEYINQMTCSAWFKTTDPGTKYDSNWALFDLDRSEWFNIYIRGDNGKIGVSTTRDSTIKNHQGNQVVNDGEWHHVTVVYDNTDLIIYVDGQIDNLIINPHNNLGLGDNDYTRYLIIGDGSETRTWGTWKVNNKDYIGDIDEVYFSETIRDENWIKLSYDLIKYQTSLVTFSSEEENQIQTTLTDILELESINSEDFNLYIISTDLTSNYLGKISFVNSLGGFQTPEFIKILPLDVNIININSVSFSDTNFLFWEEHNLETTDLHCAAYIENQWDEIIFPYNNGFMKDLQLVTTSTNIHLVWTNFEFAESKLEYCQFNESFDFSSTQVITSNDIDSFQSKIISVNDLVNIFWMENFNQEFILKTQTFDVDGRVVFTPNTVTTSENEIRIQSVGLLDNKIYLIWQDSSNNFVLNLNEIYDSWENSFDFIVSDNNIPDSIIDIQSIADERYISVVYSTITSNELQFIGREWSDVSGWSKTISIPEITDVVDFWISNIDLINYQSFRLYTITSNSLITIGSYSKSITRNNNPWNDFFNTMLNWNYYDSNVAFEDSFDYFQSEGWITNLFDYQKHTVDNGNEYNTLWYTSSEGWNWTQPYTGSGERDYGAMRIWDEGGNYEKVAVQATGSDLGIADDEGHFAVEVLLTNLPNCSDATTGFHAIGFGINLGYDGQWIRSAKISFVENYRLLFGVARTQYLDWGYTNENYTCTAENYYSPGDNIKLSIEIKNQEYIKFYINDLLVGIDTYGSKEYYQTSYQHNVCLSIQNEETIQTELNILEIDELTVIICNESSSQSSTSYCDSKLGYIELFDAASGIYKDFNSSIQIQENYELNIDFQTLDAVEILIEITDNVSNTYYLSYIFGQNGVSFYSAASNQYVEFIPSDVNTSTFDLGNTFSFRRNLYTELSKLNTTLLLTEPYLQRITITRVFSKRFTPNKIKIDNIWYGEKAGPIRLENGWIVDTPANLLDLLSQSPEFLWFAPQTTTIDSATNLNLTQSYILSKDSRWFGSFGHRLSNYFDSNILNWYYAIAEDIKAGIVFVNENMPFSAEMGLDKLLWNTHTVGEYRLFSLAGSSNPFRETEDASMLVDSSGSISSVFTKMIAKKYQSYSNWLGCSTSTGDGIIGSDLLNSNGKNYITDWLSTAYDGSLNPDYLTGGMNTDGLPYMIEDVWVNEPFTPGYSDSFWSAGAIGDTGQVDFWEMTKNLPNNPSTYLNYFGVTDPTQYVPYEDIQISPNYNLFEGSAGFLGFCDHYLPIYYNQPNLDSSHPDSSVAEYYYDSDFGDKELMKFDVWEKNDLDLDGEEDFETGVGFIFSLDLTDCYQIWTASSFNLTFDFVPLHTIGSLKVEVTVYDRNNETSIMETQNLGFYNYVYDTDNQLCKINFEEMALFKNAVFNEEEIYVEVMFLVDSIGQTFGPSGREAAINLYLDWLSISIDQQKPTNDYALYLSEPQAIQYGDFEDSESIGDFYPLISGDYTNFTSERILDEETDNYVWSSEAISNGGNLVEFGVQSLVDIRLYSVPLSSTPVYIEFDYRIDLNQEIIVVVDGIGGLEGFYTTTSLPISGTGNWEHFNMDCGLLISRIDHAYEQFQRVKIKIYSITTTSAQFNVDNIALNFVSPSGVDPLTGEEDIGQWNGMESLLMLPPDGLSTTSYTTENFNTISFDGAFKFHECLDKKLGQYSIEVTVWDEVNSREITLYYLVTREEQLFRQYADREYIIDDAGKLHYFRLLQLAETNYFEDIFKIDIQNTLREISSQGIQVSTNCYYYKPNAVPKPFIKIRSTDSGIFARIDNFRISGQAEMATIHSTTPDVVFSDNWCMNKTFIAISYLYVSDAVDYKFILDSTNPYTGLYVNMREVIPINGTTTITEEIVPLISGKNLVFVVSKTNDITLTQLPQFSLEIQPIENNYWIKNPSSFNLPPIEREYMLRVDTNGFTGLNLNTELAIYPEMPVMQLSYQYGLGSIHLMTQNNFVIANDGYVFYYQLLNGLASTTSAFSIAQQSLLNAFYTNAISRIRNDLYDDWIDSDEGAKTLPQGLNADSLHDIYAEFDVNAPGFKYEQPEVLWDDSKWIYTYYEQKMEFYFELLFEYAKDFSYEYTGSGYIDPSTGNPVSISDVWINYQTIADVWKEMLVKFYATDSKIEGNTLVDLWDAEPPKPNNVGHWRENDLLEYTEQGQYLLWTHWYAELPNGIGDLWLYWLDVEVRYTDNDGDPNLTEGDEIYIRFEPRRNHADRTGPGLHEFSWQFDKTGQYDYFDGFSCRFYTPSNILLDSHKLNNEYSDFGYMGDTELWETASDYNPIFEPLYEFADDSQNPPQLTWSEMWLLCSEYIRYRSRVQQIPRASNLLSNLDAPTQYATVNFFDNQRMSMLDSLVKWVDVFMEENPDYMSHFNQTEAANDGEFDPKIGDSSYYLNPDAMVAGVEIPDIFFDDSTLEYYLKTIEKIYNLPSKLGSNDPMFNDWSTLDESGKPDAQAHAYMYKFLLSLRELVSNTGWKAIQLGSKSVGAGTTDIMYNFLYSLTSEALYGTSPRYVPATKEHFGIENFNIGNFAGIMVGSMDYNGIRGAISLPYEGSMINTDGLYRQLINIYENPDQYSYPLTEDSDRYHQLIPNSNQLRVYLDGYRTATSHKVSTLFSPEYGKLISSAGYTTENFAVITDLGGREYAQLVGSTPFREKYGDFTHLNIYRTGTGNYFTVNSDNQLELGYICSQNSGFPTIPGELFETDSPFRYLLATTTSHYFIPTLLYTEDSSKDNMAYAQSVDLSKLGDFEIIKVNIDGAYGQEILVKTALMPDQSGKTYCESLKEQLFDTEGKRLMLRSKDLLDKGYIYGTDAEGNFILGYTESGQPVISNIDDCKTYTPFGWTKKFVYKDAQILGQSKVFAPNKILDLTNIQVQDYTIGGITYSIKEKVEEEITTDVYGKNHVTKHFIYIIDAITLVSGKVIRPQLIFRHSMPSTAKLLERFRNEQIVADIASITLNKVRTSPSKLKIGLAKNIDVIKRGIKIILTGLLMGKGITVNNKFNFKVSGQNIDFITEMLEKTTNMDYNNDLLMWLGGHLCGSRKLDPKKISPITKDWMKNYDTAYDAILRCINDNYKTKNNLENVEKSLNEFKEKILDLLHEQFKGTTALMNTVDENDLPLLGITNIGLEFVRNFMNLGGTAIINPKKTIQGLPKHKLELLTLVDPFVSSSFSTLSQFLGIQGTNLYLNEIFTDGLDAMAKEDTYNDFDIPTDGFQVDKIAKFLWAIISTQQTDKNINLYEDKDGLTTHIGGLPTEYAGYYELYLSSILSMIGQSNWDTRLDKQLAQILLYGLDIGNFYPIIDGQKPMDLFLPNTAYLRWGSDNVNNRGDDKSVIKMSLTLPKSGILASDFVLQFFDFENPNSDQMWNIIKHLANRKRQVNGERFYALDRSGGVKQILFEMTEIITKVGKFRNYWTEYLEELDADEKEKYTSEYRKYLSKDLDRLYDLWTSTSTPIVSVSREEFKNEMRLDVSPNSRVSLENQRNADNIDESKKKYIDALLANTHADNTVSNIISKVLITADSASENWKIVQAVYKNFNQLIKDLLMNICFVSYGHSEIDVARNYHDKSFELKSKLLVLRSVKGKIPTFYYSDGEVVKETNNKKWYIWASLDNTNDDIQKAGFNYKFTDNLNPTNIKDIGTVKHVKTGQLKRVLFFVDHKKNIMKNDFYANIVALESNALGTDESAYNELLNQIESGTYPNPNGKTSLTTNDVTYLDDLFDMSTGELTDLGHELEKELRKKGLSMDVLKQLLPRHLSDYDPNNKEVLSPLTKIAYQKWKQVGSHGTFGKTINFVQSGLFNAIFPSMKGNRHTATAFYNYIQNGMAHNIGSSNILLTLIIEDIGTILNNFGVLNVIQAAQNLIQKTGARKNQGRTIISELRNNMKKMFGIVSLGAATLNGQFATEFCEKVHSMIEGYLESEKNSNEKATQQAIDKRNQFLNDIFFKLQKIKEFAVKHKATQLIMGLGGLSVLSYVLFKTTKSFVVGAVSSAPNHAVMQLATSVTADMGMSSALLMELNSGYDTEPFSDTSNPNNPTINPTFGQALTPSKGYLTTLSRNGGSEITFMLGCLTFITDFVEKEFKGLDIFEYINTYCAGFQMSFAWIGGETSLYLDFSDGEQLRKFVIDYLFPQRTYGDDAIDKVAQKMRSFLLSESGFADISISLLMGVVGAIIMKSTMKGGSGYSVFQAISMVLQSMVGSFLGSFVLQFSFSTSGKNAVYANEGITPTAASWERYFNMTKYGRFYYHMTNMTANGNWFMTNIGKPVANFFKTTFYYGPKNLWENGRWYNPEKDFDGDGLTDKQELNGVNTPFGLRKTDWQDEDTDDDGIPDGVEVDGREWKGIQFEKSDPLDKDTDNDWLSDLEEYNYGTSPSNDDSDGDGLKDGYEALFIHTSPTTTDTDSDYVTDYLEYHNYHTNPNAADSDGDGLSDSFELVINTDPLNRDTDGDSIIDGVEIEYVMNPLLTDSDYDGMPDEWEIQYANPVWIVDHYDWSAGLNPTEDDHNVDFDDDRCGNEWEYIIGTNPLNNDTDYDNLSDGRERDHSSDPLNPDCDDDGLLDGDELLYGSNIFIADTDGDTILDGTEVHIYGSNPNSDDSDGDLLTDDVEIFGLHSGHIFYNCESSPIATDTDSDGLSDYEEVNSGSDGYVTNPSRADTDTDGMFDGWEVTYNFNPLNDSDAILDFDADGLINVDEFLHQCDPTDTDTDNDNATDGEEVNIYFTNPVNPDTDNDCLLDGDEIHGIYYEHYSLGWITRYTNPLERDTDGDNIYDDSEFQYHLDPTDPLDAGTDADSDGLINIIEITEVFTDPHDQDTDDDNFLDGAEYAYWKYDRGFQIAIVGFLLMLPDSESWSEASGDGLLDGDEVNIYQTDPFASDSDLDGLTDYAEVITHNTDPNDSDSDDDLLSDLEEVTLGNDNYITNPNNPHTDADSYTDYEEVNGIYGGYVTDPTNEDTDGDGLLDSVEYATYGLSPLNADWDNDGLNDNEEITYWNGNSESNWNSDFDNDGLINVKDQDSDNDQLYDGQEVNIYFTNPVNPDTDGDSYLDGVEVFIPSSPTDTFNPENNVDSLTVEQDYQPTELQISWTKIAGCTEYKIFVSEDSSSNYYYHSITADNSDYTITGLPVGTIIYIKIVPISDYNSAVGSDSNIVSCYTKQNPPTLTYSNKDHDSVRIHYDLSSTAQELILYWDQGSGSWTQVGSIRTSDGYQDFTGLSASHTYKFRARQRRSLDDFWSQDCSDFIITTSPPPQPIPGYVGSFTGIGDWVSDIQLSWEAPSNYQSGWYYKLWRKVTSGGTYTYVSSHIVHIGSSGTQQTFTDTPPSTSTEYTYRICSYNGLGQAGPYSTWTGKVSPFFYPSFDISTASSTEIPVVVSALIDNRGGYWYFEEINRVIFDYQYYMEDCFWETSINDGSVILNWFAVPNATSYEVYLFDTEKFEYTLVTTTTANENIVITSLKEDSQYIFKLKVIIKDSYNVESKTHTVKTDSLTTTNSASKFVNEITIITQERNYTMIALALYYLPLLPIIPLCINKRKMKVFLYEKYNNTFSTLSRREQGKNDN